MNTAQKGDISVAMVIARFLQSGAVVLKPMSDAHRYDIVIDRGNGFERIQCKTGRFRNGCVVFNTCSISSPHLGGRRRHYDGEIEAFAVYCPETDKCYLVPVSIAARGNATLRVDPPNRIAVKGILLAENYIL